MRLFLSIALSAMSLSAAAARADHCGEPVALPLGEGLYAERCVLCHGDEGRGDGRMSKLIEDPPPFDLTQSIQPSAYLALIISRGGARLGRSPHMPPFGQDLTEAQIESLAHYLLTLRETTGDQP